ncbi:MAG: hypothetical protein GY861_22010 [bacterium]|nr:hypothetical protein [bacterium]
MKKSVEVVGNIVYFHAYTVEDIYDSMVKWQKENRRDFLSVSITDTTTGCSCIAVFSDGVILADETEDAKFAKLKVVIETADRKTLFGVLTNLANSDQELLFLLKSVFWALA